MALPVGNFSSAYPGTLTIKVNAVWYNNWGDLLSRSGSGNLVMRAYVGPVASRVYSAYIDKYNGSVVFDVEYPGGGVVWPIGVEEVNHSNPTGGVWFYGFNPITLSAKLTKK